MIAVADASPLCYLVLIGEIEVLQKLFDQLVVPHAVLLELLRQDAPPVVRTLAANLPAWIMVERTPNVVIPGTENLHAGERAVIFVAEYLRADLVVIDEKAARSVAASRGLPVTGILGVLGEAATQGLVDLVEAIDRLRQTTFRCSPALFRATLDRYAARPITPP